MARSHPKASRLALEDEVALEYFMRVSGDQTKSVRRRSRVRTTQAYGYFRCADRYFFERQVFRYSGEQYAKHRICRRIA